MGYTTSFSGEFNVSPPLKAEHIAYLKQFAESRRVKRDAAKAELLPDPLRLAVGLPIGTDGAYYVGTADKYQSQNDDESVIDGNKPPGQPPDRCKACGKDLQLHYCQNYKKHPKKKPCGASWSEHLGHAPERDYSTIGRYTPGAQPGLWCQWIPSDDGTAIQWDEGEKFYEYVEWMQYLCDHFLTPWGYMVAGIVTWDGEEQGDIGRIIIDSPNVVRTEVAVFSWVPG